MEKPENSKKYDKAYLLNLEPRKKSIRCEFREKLPEILRDLLRCHNWREASGVLSVLMQHTMGDRSPEINRLKYEAEIQIVSHLRSDSGKIGKEIGEIYDTWMEKIGFKDKEESLSVRIQQILHFLKHDMNDDAYHCLVSLITKDLKLLSIPRSNLFIGMTYYELWYRKFLKELQSENAEHSPSESDYSLELGASFMNDKSTYSHFFVSASAGAGMSMKAEADSEPDSPLHLTKPSQLYASSDEDETSLPNYALTHTFDPSLVSLLEGMESWLLPVKLPKDPDYYVSMLNDSYYREAVKYMQVTVHSPSPVSLAALHPLVQLLLIGGRVDEAMKEVEEVCNKVRDAQAFRIRAVILETFCPDCDMLAKYNEEVLKMDPRCHSALMKLIDIHYKGGYDVDSLIEMIALHLEVAYPEHNIWNVFASCFLELFSDEGQKSVSPDGPGAGKKQIYSVGYNQKLKIFTDGASGKTWMLRGKWWLERHFSQKMLETEIKKDDLEVMTYKAACASYMYGRDFRYVSKVCGLLDNDSSRDLFALLQMHRQNLFRIYNPDHH